MNVSDSERLGSALEGLGFQAVDLPQDADVIVMNSCVVRQSAEDKVYGMMSSLKPLKANRPDRIVALMGCMVGPSATALQKRFPYVDLFMRPQEYKPLIDRLGEQFDMDVEGCLQDLAPMSPSISTYVPIIKGCDEFCSFCIIPYRRGRQSSRPIDEVVREINLLVNRGVKEVTLLGQTVDAYGHDLDSEVDLADLMYEINSIEGLQRVRFLTSHPKYMSDRIIEAVASLPKLCEHINLPFQAGDDQVLQDMRRGYTSKEYRYLVDKIRNSIPGVSLSTDLIVGFPGETQKQFEASLDLIEKTQFDKVHVASYSTREGTIAHRKMKDTVSAEEKKSRMKLVEELQRTVSSEINRKLDNQIVEVLVEASQDGKWRGRTRTNKLVFFSHEASFLGEIVPVRVTKTGPWSLSGVVEEEPKVIV